MGRTLRSHRGALKIGAVAAVIALALAACGGSSSNDNPSGGGSSDKPVMGGTLKYALEGNTTNFCIPRAQLAISGILVVESMYDTLARPTQDPNVFAPYLAKSITPNADFTEWTIEVRDGVMFHDGTALTAEAVKQNIDAWKAGILLSFVFGNIDSTTVSGNSVIVKMKVPWVAFPGFLWATGRAGIAAPSQLESADCDTKLVGTGPFKLKTFDPTSGNVSVTKNADYWRTGFPYLDGIDFIVQQESSQRINGLEGGQFDIIPSSGGLDLADVKELTGITIQEEAEGRQEISHVLVNVEHPPLNDLRARKAIAMGTDRDKLNAIANKGTGRYAYQVFDTEIMGYVENPGFPEYDPEAAKKLVDEVKAANGGKFEFDIQSTFDQTTQAVFQEVKRQLGLIGITVNLPTPVDQSTIINMAIGGEVDSFGWRNYPGQDPDSLFVWFKGGSVVNFNHVNDPIINQTLDAGRSEPDANKRKALYETFNERMSSQVYNLWTWYTAWFVAHDTTVHGISGPDLPNEAGAVGTEKPVDLLAGYHQLLGIWKTK